MDTIIKNLRNKWNLICEKSSKLKDRLEDRNECYMLLMKLIKGVSVGSGDEKIPKIMVPNEVANKRLEELMNVPEAVQLKNKYVQLYASHWRDAGREEEVQKIQHDAWKKMFWDIYNERKGVASGEIDSITPEQLEKEAIKWATNIKMMNYRKMYADAHGPANGDLSRKRKLLANLKAFENQPIEPSVIEWCKQKLIDKYKLNIQANSNG